VIAAGWKDSQKVQRLPMASGLNPEGFLIDDIFPEGKIVHLQDLGRFQKSPDPAGRLRSLKLYYTLGVSLNVPAGLWGKKKQFTSEEILYSREIAQARIHVERTIGCVFNCITNFERLRIDLKD